MPIIAKQCLPGSHANSGFMPQCAWPADCYIQWGASGVVFRDQAKCGNYGTAFFEAFGKAPGQGSARGEGKTVADAETACFDKFLKYGACVGHVWGRRGYTNGGGWCLKCGAFATAFRPIWVRSNIDGPLTSTDFSMIQAGATRPRQDPRAARNGAQSLTALRLKIKARRNGLVLPDASLDDDDAWEAAVEEAIADW
jgi:hypothetical protein